MKTHAMKQTHIQNVLLLRGGKNHLCVTQRDRLHAKALVMSLWQRNRPLSPEG